MNNKTISKFDFGIATLAGLAMAWFGWALSFSQNALDQYGWVLLVYLISGSLGYRTLAVYSFNRNSLVRVLWLFKVQWGYVFYWLSFSFALVAIANVWQQYTMHIFATGCVVLGSGVLPLYLRKWWRGSAYIMWGLALFYFYQTWQSGLHTIAWGEMALTAVALGITWVIINEQMKE